MITRFQLFYFTIFLLYCTPFQFSLDAQKVTNVADDGVSAAMDIVRTYENHTSSLSVLDNDNGLGSGISNLYLAYKPKHGIANVLPDFTIVYTPDMNFRGEDMFTYWVCVNADNQCDSASVLVNVLDFNFNLATRNDTIAVIYGQSHSMSYDIIKNDSCAYDEPLVVTILSQPLNGNLSVNSDNTISPGFNNEFLGKDTASYRLCDVEGDCDTAFIYFNVINGENPGDLFIPNAFSPNGDGYNDRFYMPQLSKDVRMKLTVFTQWGQLVYSNDAYENNWDGKGNLGSYDGKELASGTYYYVLVLGNDSAPISGNIYLSR